MGRPEDRHRKKTLNKRLTDDQFKKLQSDINQEFINREVKSQIDNFKSVFLECTVEAFKKNGISNSKSKAIADDIELIILRRVSKVE